MDFFKKAVVFAENASVSVVCAAAEVTGCRDAVCEQVISIRGRLADGLTITEIQFAHYNSKSTAEKNFPDWIAKIKDEMPVWAMTIPGTHDTCALHGGDLVATQSLTLSQQLEAGIRFLDIRARHFNDALPIHHELVYQHKSFTSVMEDICEFLTKHPSEFVLMQVQKEYESSGNKTTFDGLVRDVCLQFEHFLPAGAGPDGLTDPSRVTVGELRGKVCVMQNYSGVSVPGAIHGGWVDQNEWDMTWEQIHSHKIPRILEHFQASKSMENVIRRNWLSAASASAWPYRVGRETNKVALEFLETTDRVRNGHGILITNFPGSGLVEICIRHTEESMAHW